MGGKFYRGGDKSKKIKKRVTQTRTWARTLKWVACKTTSIVDLFRSRASNFRRWTPIQGLMGQQQWLSFAPRNEAILNQLTNIVRSSKPS